MIKQISNNSNNSNKSKVNEEAIQTKKNTWRQGSSKKNNDSEPIETVRLNMSQENSFILDRKNLDYMGSAVVNTMTHLKNYSIMLW